MKQIIRTFAASLLAACSFLTALTVTAAPAQAQATRTWVSGVGDDVNPCSRTAPCKTFAGAISKTAANGEINCLDPGGFGAVTITKSITIDCTGTFGSILNSGGVNGVNVNDSATGTPGTIDVILRGLSIDGGGVTLGLNGIRFTSGRSLLLEDIIIQNQSTAGISFQPQHANTELHGNEVTITDSGTNGVLIQPTGFNGSSRVQLTRVQVENNTNGIRVDTTGNSGLASVVSIEDGDVSGNTTNGIAVVTAAGTAVAAVSVHDSTVTNNSGTGISATGPAASARVGNTTIFGNGTGVSATAPSAVFTYGNNRLDGNSSNGGFTMPVLPSS